MTNICGIYTILMCAGLIATWAVLLVTGRAIDPAQTQFQTWSLLTAEFVAGALLILGGWGVITRRPAGIALHLVSLGMLLYLSIFSVGVFDGAGNRPATIFFGVVALLTAAVVAIEAARTGHELAIQRSLQE